MKKGDVNRLKKHLSTGKSLEICIPDNNSVVFLTRVREIVSPEKIFKPYDKILIPQWVWAEICDSEKRKNYVNDLKQYSEVQIIDEYDYLKLVDYKEAELFHLFLNCCYNVTRLVSFIRKNILKNRPVEELDPYEEWLGVFYEEGLDQKKLSNGRIQRINAGEISISVLSYILSFYYSNNIDNVTIFSSDRDTYDFVTKAKEKFCKDERFKSRDSASITFKSNDFLIYEWTRLGYIDEQNIQTFVESYRQARRIRFTRKKLDNSIEEQEKTIDNTEFMEMLKDSTIYLIF